MTDEKKYVTEINCETDVETTREFTVEEYQSTETKRIAWETEKAQAEAQAETTAALKASARAKLISGTPLTEEEAAVLVI